MNDDKRPLEKGGEAVIPLPAVASAPENRKQRPFGRVFKFVAILALFYVAGYRWYSVNLKPEIEAETAAWLANPFALNGWERPGPGQGHHKVLNGKAAEKLFLTVPNEASAILASRKYATKPHMAGTLNDLETAEEFFTLLQTELGITPTSAPHIYGAGTPSSRNATLSIPHLTSPTAWIDVYFPMMGIPGNRSIEILEEDGSVAWAASLEEVADEKDEDAGKYSQSVPTFHGFSSAGEVKGKLVFAGYGRQEDYKALVEKGVNLTGTIVLVKYGGIFRGLKVKGAEELGAAGVLIYSDPSDDGSVTEENGYLAYPNGPARNPTSVQRGSVQYISKYPGDPTTPGYPAYENSTRTAGDNIPSIPSIPLSWANAKVLLKEVEEGGQNRTVSFINKAFTTLAPIWNTMGVIPGHIKDEVVVIGNHRDAWVLGATDPSSGTASVNEVVRGFGTLLKAGWKPLRTLVFASWDAEEWGLIGSTEWGEDFAEFIDKHVVAYLNIDSSVSGSRFRANASPSLAHLVRSTAEELPHPTKPEGSLWDATRDSGILTGKVNREVQAMYEEGLQQADDLGVTPLGSGSDYTVFLQRIGVASTNGGFSSTLQDPVYHYHSVFDSEQWQELYGDPGFFRHVAVAKHLGLQALRLIDSIVLPLNTTHYSLELEAYLDKVESIASSTSIDVDFTSLRNSIHNLQASSVALDKEKTTAERHLKRIIHRIVRRKIVRRKLRKVWCKLKKVFGKECRRKKDLKEGVPAKFTTGTGEIIDLRGGHSPVWLKEHGGRRGACQAHSRPWKRLHEAIKRVRAVNVKLASFERGLISEEGIKDREWYKHLGVAPGKWLGYGATTLPGLTESFTIENNATLAKYEAKRLKSLIDDLATHIQP